MFVTACSQNTSVSEQTSVRAADAAELSARIGIDVSLPDKATNAEFFIINDLIGETQFTYNGIIFTHRVSKVYSDTALCGIPGKTSKTDEFTIAEQTEVTIRTFKDGATVALWYENGNHHSLYSLKTVGTDVFTEICENL